ncbi:hypothetical protein [Paracoccus yeei]|uniref:hypothetical protein n=1 Tax=Paracoccus yeei TaxID=147645 RepID=UPI001748B300|nr:hypothetical protein [Paracoccus yeei]
MTITTKISEAMRRFADAIDGGQAPMTTDNESDNLERHLLRSINGRKFTGLTDSEWDQIVEIHRCYDAYASADAPLTKDNTIDMLIFGVQRVLDQSCGGRHIHDNETIHLIHVPMGPMVDQIIPGNKEREDAEHLAWIHTHQLADVVASIQRFADSGGDHRHIAGLARMAGTMVSEVREALENQFERNI